MIQLKPIRESTSEYDEIEKKIKILFKKEIYLPLLREFTDRGRLQNSQSDLLEAIRSGRLTFHRGKFSGKLHASLSKELRALGAVWSRSQRSYVIAKKYLPVVVQNAIASSSHAFAQKLQKIDEKLAKILPEELASKLKISHLFDQTLWKVERAFQDSVKNIIIAPKLTDDQARRISEEWETNMRLWIKDFTREQILKLRQNIKKSVYAGNRYEDAVKSIQQSYGVTARKAKFLARQETSLLMAKHKEVKYQSAGIDEYKWKSVTGTPAHPVRPRHKELNDASSKGKIFRFDNPPVTSEAGQPTRRNNPQQDYNCRCTSIPVVRFKRGNR